MIGQTQADLFPLVRGGGLFLIIVGVAILLGALQFRWRNPLLGAGAALATAATIATAAHLAAPFGSPTLLQVGSLVVAVLLEIVVLAWAIRRFSSQGERVATIAVLAVVGAHFVLMAPAFGALIVLLGALTVANALARLHFKTYALRTLWAVDGLLKLAVGGAMFGGQFWPCFPCASA
jgi:hypothetical protein